MGPWTCAVCRGYLNEEHRCEACEEELAAREARKRKRALSKHRKDIEQATEALLKASLAETLAEQHALYPENSELDQWELDGKVHAARLDRREAAEQFQNVLANGEKLGLE